ncbi:hypothetical protein BU23DRAFT_583040 [Bimuria novae-zelandiae CBS 107.79]|uniref:Mediator of RNA polymerase II transcription subunit 17 n=1 Tax=Bimuria novae-zelandiae CBS 107.79 TaxID=1447943 RepID=A0A6A5UYD6_9PLEO|nr:hypothetical protein BU23DRAFT_583040 [Bimuria novae-zelandiae CBS 107.79]
MAGLDALSNVALRPWPAPEKEALSKEDIFAQVGQLTSERKQYLREITEKSLLEDIAAGRDGIVESVEEDKKEEVLSQAEMVEKLGKARHDVYSKLEWASFAAGNALNLVSLILSRDLSKHPNRKESENLYTPMFQQMKVPRGSLGLVKEALAEQPDPSKIRPDDPKKGQLEYIQRRKALVMKGSRIEALDWATDTLLKAATDLESNIRKETRYWSEMLSISDKGWPVQRTWKGIKNAPYAVKFGPPEASNQFRSRGLAPLRMDDDGSIILDPALFLKPKTLRVRISEDDNIMGASQATIHGALDELAIEKSIQLARASLFEEELFYEMSIESRQLLSYGVELRDTVIHVPVPGEHSVPRKILIDCIAQDDSSLVTSDASQSPLAQSIAEGLRILLAHEHRMRLFRRTRLPPPMTQHKRQQPTPPLLRTLLAMLSHMNAVNSLHVYLGTIVSTLRSAGLEVALQATREMEWEKLTETIKKADTTKDFTATDQLLATFIRPFEGKATLSLSSSVGSPPENVIIGTRTYIGPPHFGTEHKLTLPPSLIKLLNLEHDPQRQLKLTSTEEVKTYLDWILSLDISQTLLFQEYHGRSAIKSSEPCIWVVSRGSKKGFIKEDYVEIAIENATMKVTARAQGQLATGVAVESFTWNGTSGRPSLKDKVRSWLG